MAMPGDVIINNCLVISPRGTLNLNNNFLGSRVFESIFDPNNICEIDFLDADDAVGSMQFLGDEIITFSFNAPGTQPLDYIFALDVVEQVDVPGTQKTKQYIFHGVGQETMFSKSNFVQKSYNTNISSMVTDIHKTYLQSRKIIDTESTDGLQNLVIPNLRPFDAIDMMRKRAVSMSNPSSTFLYFEDANKYNFKTIEGMYETDTVKTFVRGDAVDSSIYINTWNNIIAYEVPQIISSTDRIALGGLKQRVGTFDLRTRQYKTIDKTNTGGFNSSFFSSLYGSTFGRFNFIPIDTIKPPSYISKMTPDQLSYLSNVIQRYITLKVPGDTVYTVGQVITVNLPESISTTGPPELDPLISGNYLISRLCRNIGKIQDVPRFFDAIEGITPI